MDWFAGLAGWRWIFIIEGLASVAVGLLSTLLLLDSPATSKILTPNEKRWLVLRKIIQDGGREIQDEGTRTTWKVIRSVLLDWKLYLAAIIYWPNTGALYGVKFTTPQIIKNMGYSPANAQLLTCVLLTGFAILFAYAGDLEHRIAESYTAIFICCLGFYPITPNTAAWMSNNLAGPAKRASGIGYMLSMADTADIIGSFIYKEDEKPTYPTGYGTSIGVTVLGCSYRAGTPPVAEHKLAAKMTEAEIESGPRQWLGQ